MEVCRRPFDPFIYHGRSVNARLTLIGRARRSIGRIGRAGGLGGRPAPQTTLIVHMDEPYSMIDLAQESGRGGRDGLPCRHIILLPMLWRPREGTCSKLVEFLRGLKCRRWVLQEYTDGSGFDCFSSGSKRCDSCRSMATCAQPNNMASKLADTITTFLGMTWTYSLPWMRTCWPYQVRDPPRESALAMLCYLSQHGKLKIDMRAKCSLY
jgi:hypothetical protein